MLVRTVDRRELVNAMAWVSIPAMIGPLMGPPLGGFITTYASWHWIFLINVPIGLLGIVLVTRFIENIKAEVPERFDFPGMILSGTAVAGLTFGLSVAGFDIVPWQIVAAIIGIGTIALGFYLAYARRAPAPILDFSLMKLPTFRASLIGGCPVPRRRRCDAVPSCRCCFRSASTCRRFQSGLITFTSTMGALIVKGAAPAMLKRFGFRTILLMNAILGGLSISACAIFTESTPFLVMVAILMVGGFFRSLQFTSNNALAYAEVPASRMSRATALAAVGQQVSLATGVAIGALDGGIRRPHEGAARHHGVGFPGWIPAGRLDRSEFGTGVLVPVSELRAPTWRTGFRQTPDRPIREWVPDGSSLARHDHDWR